MRHTGVLWNAHTPDAHLSYDRMTAGRLEASLIDSWAVEVSRDHLTQQGSGSEIRVDSSLHCDL
jgi:hypothetical protein